MTQRCDRLTRPSFTVNGRPRLGLELCDSLEEKTSVASDLSPGKARSQYIRLDLEEERPLAKLHPKGPGSQAQHALTGIFRLTRYSPFLFL